jgi:uncharacterized Zn-finger protein
VGCELLNDCAAREFSTHLSRMENIMPDELKPANAERQYEVSHHDLPLSCPMPDMEQWNSHPRVYLPIEKTGRITCPYCDAEFTLKD